MMKRLLLAAIIALSTAGVTNLAVASPPFPTCYPCDPAAAPQPTATAVNIPAEAR